MYTQISIGWKSQCSLENSDTKVSGVLRVIPSNTLQSGSTAMTMLRLKDGAGSEDGYGYLDIVDFIIRNCEKMDIGSGI